MATAAKPAICSRAGRRSGSVASFKDTAHFVRQFLEGRLESRAAGIEDNEPARGKLAKMSANSLPQASANAVPGYGRAKRLGEGKAATGGHSRTLSRSRKTKSGKVAGRHANTGLVDLLEFGCADDATVFR